MNNLKYSLSILISFFVVSIGFGSEENLFNGLTLDEIDATSEIVVQDAWFTQYLLGIDEDYFTTQSAHANVKLWFDDSEKKRYSENWKVKISYDILLTREDGVEIGHTGKELEIDYHFTSPYKDINLHHYNDAIYIKAKVFNVTYELIGLEGVKPADIHLDIELNTVRYYNLDPTEVVEYLHYDSYDPTELENGNQLNLVWDYVEGAESYDLEWLFIDEPIAILSSLAGVYSFKNATRVNVYTTNYEINLAYPRGIFLFRVRPVGKKIVAGELVRIEGKWSRETIIDDGEISVIPGTEKFAYEGLMTDLNWQYQATFAEEGKRGEMMGIYDGSLKPRQNIAINNSDNTAVVSDIVYDYLGRASISLLPTPEENKGLGFYESRLDFGSGNYYDYENFDIIDVSTSVPFSKIDNPDNMAGLTVNEFYSNPEDGGNYIANAEDYPFARTTFTKDGTNRVRKQTAVGGSVIGSNSLTGVNAKIINYLYGTPTQEELYRLFGNEVGFASHYKKNAVIDQNGQAHIQYIDMSGRVVATGLAGDAPDNLLQIDSYPDSFDAILADLTVNNTFDTDGNLLITKKIIVPYSTQYNFKYKLDEIQFNDGCLLVDENVNYDLLIYIEDENNERVNLNPTVDPEFPEIPELEYELFNIPSQTELTFSLTLPAPGMYTIHKKLSINESHLNLIEIAFLTAKGCLEDIKPAEILCNPTCREICFDSYGYINENGNKVYQDEDGYNVAIEKTVDGVVVYEFFEGKLMSQLDDIKELISICEENCNKGVSFSSDPCEYMLDRLKRDLSPNGQYFENTPFGEFFPSEGNANGWLQTYAVGALSELISAGEIPPGSNWNYVKNNWEQSWIDILVEFHPEHCIYLYLDYCNKFPCIAKKYNGVDLTSSLYKSHSSWNLLSYSEYSQLMSTTLDIIGTSSSDSYLFNPTGVLFQPSAAEMNSYIPYESLGTSDWDELDPSVRHFPHLKAEIDALLFNYYDVGSDNYQSIWYVIDNPDNLHLDWEEAGYSSEVGEFYEALHGVDGIIQNPDLSDDPTKVSKFQFFKSAYLYIREYVKYNSLDKFSEFGYCNPSPCGTKLDRLIGGSSNQFTAEGFLIHYPKNSVFESYSVDLTIEDAEIAFADACSSQCEQFAVAWLSELGNCSADVADMEEAVSHMVEICTNSCDEDNPEGTDASLVGIDTWRGATIPPLYTFDDVINYLNSISPANNCPSVSHPKPTAVDFLENLECDAINEFVNGFYNEYDIDIPSTGINLNTLSLVDQSLFMSEIEERLSIAEETTFALSIADIQSNWIQKCNDGIPPTHIIDAFVRGEIMEYDILNFESDCGTDLEGVENYYREEFFKSELEDRWETYLANYKVKAWENIATRETFTMEYELQEYHYTLFYYDQAGNLIKTVPPSGIYRKERNFTVGIDEPEQSSTLTAAEIQECKDHLIDGGITPYHHPNHKMITNYKYNSLQQLIEQTTPDGGKTTYWYDALGRLIVSQNARQAPSNRIYSYTVYDGLGRVVEAGEITGANIDVVDDPITKSALDYSNWLGAGTKREVMRTIYNGYQESDLTEITNEMGIDTEAEALNLRGRIGSVVYYYGVYNDEHKEGFDHASHYNYDYAGNVKTVIQENRLLKMEVSGTGAEEYLKFARTDYTYDLISGNVIQVNYQDQKKDQFHYRYDYDANNRLTVSYSSKDGQIWEKESKNFYFAHGPLARQEIGDEIVQACDYVYTVNGWLKTVNSSVNNESNDAGRDGFVTNINENNGRDAIGFSLHYFENDYLAVGESAETNSLLVEFDNPTFGNTTHDLYNGNISQMITSVNNVDEYGIGVLANKYRYDQLQRIKSSNVFQSSTSANLIRDNNKISTTSTDLGNYSSTYSYDGNGNILSLRRFSNNALDIDKLSYNYNYDPSGNTTNQLLFVKDLVEEGVSGIDIDNQDSDNYTYDEIGQLIKDKSNDISDITWTVTGKVKEITYDNSLNPDLKTNIKSVYFEYDAMGIRVSKKVHFMSPGINETYTTYYMHDASGNVLATYEHYKDLTGAPVKEETVALNEHHLYGSKRLGIANRDYDMTSIITPTNEYSRILGGKSYELSNHLGNVLAVVSDRKIAAVRFPGSDEVKFYVADVTSHSEYYPFGMKSRSGKDGGNYRFGFNGMEEDDEIKGEGNSVNYDARMYDPRIGRWISKDKLEAAAPGWTPYRAFFNNPNFWIDPDGNIEWPLNGNTAVNKKDTKNGGRSLENTIVRTSLYQEIRSVGTSPHIGIDYRASIGTNVYSLGDGTVSGLSTTRSGIIILEVTYVNGDILRFLHLTSYADGIEVGTQIYEGQVIAYSGNSGGYPAHLHVDGKDAEGNSIDPEATNYGTITNEQFFGEYEGDYSKIPRGVFTGDYHPRVGEFNLSLNLGWVSQDVAWAGAGRIRLSDPSSTLSVRSTPGGEKISNLTGGAKVQFTGVNQSGGGLSWSEIYWDDAEGVHCTAWVCTDYVDQTTKYAVPAGNSMSISKQNNK